MLRRGHLIASLRRYYPDQVVRVSMHYRFSVTGIPLSCRSPSHYNTMYLVYCYIIYNLFYLVNPFLPIHKPCILAPIMLSSSYPSKNCPIQSYGTALIYIIKRIRSQVTAFFQCSRLFVRLHHAHSAGSGRHSRLI